MMQKSRDVLVEKLLLDLGSIGWQPTLTRDSYELIIGCGFRRKNQTLAAIAAELAVEHRPLTLRGLFYQIVSAGHLPSTATPHYRRIGRLMCRLRERKVVPYEWIVDSLRQTRKPSSWSGLTDYAETVRDTYRMNFWEHLDNYVHIFCEKDAIAGTLFPVTSEYDVALSPIRGYCSDSFAHHIGMQFRKIEKPIHCYYLGDYDPSGFDIERDVKDKLKKHSGVKFNWARLGVNDSDFEQFNLVRLEPKKSDRRWAEFVKEHGQYAAEIDAIPPTELRRRVRVAIEQHIPSSEWERLKQVERNEQQSWQNFLVNMF